MTTRDQRFMFAVNSSKKLLMSLFIGIFILGSCTSRSEISTTTPSPSSSTPEIITTPTSTELPATDPVATITPTMLAVDLREKLSPGLYLAYWSQGTWYIRKVGGSSSIQLLPGINSEFYTEIKLSSDSNRIAFSNSPGQVSVYELRTGELTTFANREIKQAYQFQWLPDGDTLLYLGTPEQYLIPDAYVGIYSISLRTGETSKVVDWADDRFEYGLDNLRLSKDGQWLAFHAPRRSEMMAPDPDYAVYVMDMSCLKNPETCAESIRLADGGYAPEWAPDGRLWWVCSQERMSALCVVDADMLVSSQVFVTANELTDFPDALFSYFSWSPDGKYVAINVYQSSNPDDGRDEIYLVSADGSQPIKVTSASDGNEYLEWWSPDSKYIAYFQILGNTEPQGDLGIRFAVTDLYLYNLETGTKTDFVNTSGEREVFGFFINIK